MKSLIKFARAAAMTMLLVLMLTAARTAWAQSWPAYVSDVVVVGGGGYWENNSTVLYYKNTLGYTLCAYNLNEGSGGEAVYLLYKTADRNHPDGGYVADFKTMVGLQYYESDDQITIDGVTYDKVPYADVAGLDFKGDLNYRTDKHNDSFIILYYRKTTHNDYTAVSKITIDTDGSNALDGRDLNQGASGEYIYMHVTRDYLTNRPKTDPTFTADFVYDGEYHSVVTSSGEKIDPNDQIFFRINKGAWVTEPDKVINAGSYDIEYYVSGNSNSYHYDSPIQQRTLTITPAKNTVTQAPTAKTLYATGDELELVNTGSAKFGSLEYRLGSGDFSTSLPKATAAGTYTVYYRAEGSNNYDASEAQSMTVTINPRKTFEGFTQDGDGNYLIDTKEKYESFAEYVNVYGYDFADSKFLLTTDLTGITTKVGNVGLDLPFSGTFDGGGHSITVNITDNNNQGAAPFRVISGATIKNLVVTGSVTSNENLASGLVGFAMQGSTGNLIKNCVVSTTIDGNSYAGGILGNGTTSEITIEGCVFDGLIKNASTIGVFFGRGDNGDIKNCLYKENPNQTGDLPFANHTAGSETNCHNFTDLHTLTLGEGVTATFPETDKTYDLSKITTYADGGMAYNDNKINEGLNITLSTDKEGYIVQYTDGNNNTVPGDADGTLTLTMPTTDITATAVLLGYEFILPECFEIINGVNIVGNHVVGKDVVTIQFARKSGYTEPTSVSIVGGDPLTPIDGYYTVTVDKDMEIEAKGFEQTDDNYTIATVADLIAFSNYVNNGDDFSGKTITVVANIDFNPAEGVSNNFTAIGTEEHPFLGTFDGGNDNGYTISGIRISASTGYQGLFGYVGEGATVKNVTIDKAKISSTVQYCNYYGGIAGYNYGSIEYCTSSAVVSSTQLDCDFYGGIAGGNDGIIKYCTSSAKVSSSGTNCDSYGGIAGGNFGKIENNFVINAEINAINFGAIVGYNYDALLTDNYYYNCNVKGCDGEDIAAGDGALAVYKLTLGEGVNITSPAKPTFTYGEDNYYKSELPLTFNSPAGSILFANGKIINNAESYQMPAEDVTITAGSTVSFTLPECFEITNSVEHIDGKSVKKGVEIKFARKFGYTKPTFVSIVGGDKLTPIDGFYTVTVNNDMEITAEGSTLQTEADNYEIATVADLIAFSNAVNNGNDCSGKTITVVKDIDFKPAEGVSNNFTAIGTEDHPFKGTFDGGNDKGYTISGIRISASTDYQGLFGYVGEGATVKNVTIDKAKISSTVQYCDYYGGIAGYNNGGIITNCTSSAEVSSTVQYCYDYGGIAGCNVWGNITNCTSSAKVSSSGIDCDYYGGIAGRNDGSIKNCTSSAVVSSKGQGCYNYGGIAGYNDGGTIENCASSAVVFSTGQGCYYYGGIAGRQNGYGYGYGSIKNCTSSAVVSSKGQDCYYYGGIAGSNDGTLSDNFVINAIINHTDDRNCFGAIVGENSKTLTNNYYYNCKVNDVVTTNVGCNGKDITEDDGAVSALIIDGNSEQSLSIESGEHRRVVYLRNFTAGIPTTIMLPFVFKASDFSNETFYYFDGINTETWTATMAAKNQATTLSANTPYIFTPSAETAARQSFVFRNVSITSVEPIAVLDKDKNWAFQGTYDYKIWNTDGNRDIKNIYGFAATPSTNTEGDYITAGNFVRAGLKARIRPTRAYLEYNGEDENLLSKSAIELPDRIKVVFIDKETSSVIDDPAINPSDPNGDIPTPTSELNPAANVKVWSYDKTIYIASRPGTDYRIIDVNGRLLKESTTQTDRDEVRLGSRSGIVVVIIGNKAFKLNY